MADELLGAVCVTGFGPSGSNAGHKAQDLSTCFSLNLKVIALNRLQLNQHLSLDVRSGEN